MPADRKLSALVVNDHEPHMNALTRSLQNAGFDVLMAITGTEALQRAAVHPDLILLDVDLPDVNGFEVCRRIKRNADTAAIPVIFLSATHQTQYAVDEGREAGAVSFLFHPIESKTLMAVIRGSLAKAAHHAT